MAKEPIQRRKGGTFALHATSIMLALALAAAVGLLVYFAWFHKPTEPRDPDRADVSLLSQQVARQCAMGRQTVDQASVSAALAKYLSGLDAGAKVSTTDVGALIDRITPNDQGLAFYKAYTDCLKQQTAFLLGQRGVTLVAPDETQLEEAKDRRTLEAVSAVGPNVPKSRLVQILGEPVFSGSDDNMPDGLTADFYQYKYMLFVADYRMAGKRVAIAMSTKDPARGQAMFPDQFFGVRLGDVAERCGPIVLSGRQSAISKVCEGQTSSEDIRKVFLFKEVTTFEYSPASCDFKKFDAKRCPGMAQAPAFGVILLSDNTDDTAQAVIDAWWDENDFGHEGGFSWWSDREGERMTESDEVEVHESEQQTRARMADKRRRLIRLTDMQITPPI